jgi:hypothetical protein
MFVSGYYNSGIFALPEYILPEVVSTVLHPVSISVLILPLRYVQLS